MNTIRLIGTVKEKPKFSHEVLGEKFYEFVLETKRKSETKTSFTKTHKWGEIRGSNPCITEPQSAVLTTSPISPCKT